MQCFHCGREVKETIHTRRGYKVDYYLLHTGNTEWAFFKNPKDNAPTLRYLKLTQPTDIFTCVQCHALPAIRKQLDDDFAGLRSILESIQEGDKPPNSTPRADSDG